ncbi:hypothetical protein LBBP_03396 [Leptospira borgpetersenii serovar Ballum]|uniref:Uncharacterized protein n=2 Tax=Leptospira borgpetersenii TaxID=174 RepID=A0A0S2IV92_LEPBO|nr:hypothetical protein LBBP_03396 [Leptospira borgpetersenii serovar Ballum]
MGIFICDQKPYNREIIGWIGSWVLRWKRNIYGRLLRKLFLTEDIPFRKMRILKP